MKAAAIAKIAEQQKGLEDTVAFVIGEQLKEICEKSKKAAELVVKDLENEEMGLEALEKEFSKYAKEKAQGKGSYCIKPREAEELIKKFYGIPEDEQEEEEGAPNLLSFF